MRAATVLGATALAFVGTATVAKAAPWCAWYDAWTYNCGFYTFQQCLDTVHGAGGYCQRNVYEASEPASPPEPARPRGKRRHRDD
jgi:hypothetical protein